MKKIKIGKYTLESLTKGLYRDALVIYREYIQNSLDSIDKYKTINSDFKGTISIKVDKNNHNISITDDGYGVPADDAFDILTSIGKSNKEKGMDRGFRGIGRLAGLAYCDKLVFTTSCDGERKAAKLEINSTNLMHSLYLDTDEELIDVLDRNLHFSIIDELEDSHYFKVELMSINDNGKKDILNTDKIINYIAEYLPVPLNLERFTFGNEVMKYANENTLPYRFYNIKVNEQQVYKKYSDNFIVGQSGVSIDNVSKLSTGFLKNTQGEYIAWYWFTESNYLGTLYDSSIKGFRLKSKGIGVGDKLTLNSVFKEGRFNGWLQGEVHILDTNIIPNSSREDFESNDAYNSFKQLFEEVADSISNDIRKASIVRNASAIKSAKPTNSDLVVRLDKYIDSISEIRKQEIEMQLKEELDESIVNIVMEIIRQ